MRHLLDRLGRQQYLDEDLSNTQTRLYAYNEFSILDTKTWTWLSPKSVRGEIAHPRYDASAALLYGKYWVILGGVLLDIHHLTYAFTLMSSFVYIGISEFTWTNDANVLEIPQVSSSLANSSDASSDTFTWLYNITDPTLGLSKEDESKQLEGYVIAGITLGSLAAVVLIITLIWKLRHKKGGPPTMITAIWHGVISMI